MNLQSNSIGQLYENPIESLADLERKIDSITKNLSRPYFNKILKDLLKSNPANARIIVEYILTEQTEINIKDSTKESKIKTLVEIVKSFKNSSGFYKINGTLENHGSIILSDIKVIKYYKVPSVNDTTLICYEEGGFRFEYKSINQLPSESFFLTIPNSNINSN